MPIPKNTSLNGFMPALMNSSVASPRGTSGALVDDLVLLLGKEVEEVLSEGGGGLGGGHGGWLDGSERYADGRQLA